MKKQILLLTLLVAPLAFSKTFTYRLSPTPYQDIETCNSEARLLAKKVSEQASVETFNVHCDWNEYTGATSILIDYNAEAPLKVVSTYPPNHVLVYLGFYKTVKDCESDLSEQENIFRKETGLNILTSFCYLDSPTLKTPFAVRIEAIGEAKKAPFHTHLFSDAQIVSPKTEEVTAKISSYLSEKKATLVHVSYRTVIPENTITLFYYAEKEIDFERQIMYELPDFKLCQSELTVLEEKLLSQGIKLPLAYCGTPFLPGKSADLLLFTEAGLIRAKQSIEKFKDYKTCSENRDALVKKYQAVSGINILAGVCQRSLSAKEYTVSLVIKN